MPGHGLHLDLRSQQLRGAAHDRHSLAAIALGIANLNEYIEDAFEIGLGDARSGVSHGKLDAFAALAAGDQHAALLGVAQGVGDQVHQALFEQPRIAGQDRAIRSIAQFETHLDRQRAPIVIDPIEQGIGRDRFAGVEAGCHAVGCQRVPAVAIASASLPEARANCPIAVDRRPLATLSVPCAAAALPLSVACAQYRLATACMPVVRAAARPSVLSAAKPGRPLLATPASALLKWLKLTACVEA